MKTSVRIFSKKKLLCNIILAIIFAFYSNSIKAQPVFSTNFETNVTPYSAITTDNIVVNADMLEFNGGNLKAIVWGSQALGNTYLYVEDNFGNSIIRTLPGMYDADVVLCDEKTITGDEYRVAIVGMNSTTGFVELETFLLLNIGLPGFWAAGLGPTVISFGPADGNPHIDMFNSGSSPFTYAGGLPALQNYAIVWAESQVAYIRTGQISSPSSSATYVSSVPMPGPCLAPDVAATWDEGAGQLFVYIVSGITGGVDELDLAEIDMFTPTVVSHTTLQSGVSVFAPRIESMNLYTTVGGGGPVRWQVVCSQKPVPGTGTWQVYGYNSTGASTHLSAPFAVDDIKAPAVAGGLDLSGFGGNIGNRQYTTGYFPWANTDIWSKGISAVSGAPISTAYYQVNSNPVNYPYDASRNYAISNCSNTGKDILSAWYNGTDIVYKLSANTMAFKQATETVTISGTGGISVFPNPTQGELHINGASGERYKIVDVTGKVQSTGIATGNVTIDITHIPNGLYVVQLPKEGAITQNVRITKQ